MLFTLGLGMFIGAQVAGWVEAAHTTPASKNFGEQVQAKGKEIAQLSEKISKDSAAEVVADQEQIEETAS